MGTNAVPVQPMASHASEVRRLIAAGEGRNAIARKLGISTASVSRLAQSMGLTFDRAGTRAATEARKVDLDALRTRALEGAYREMVAGYDELEQGRRGEYRAILRDEGGIERESYVGRIPARDRQQLANAILIHRRIARDIELAENPAGQAAQSLLSALAAQVGIQDVPNAGS